MARQDIFSDFGGGTVAAATPQRVGKRTRLRRLLSAPSAIIAIVFRGPGEKLIHLRLQDCARHAGRCPLKPPGRYMRFIVRADELLTAFLELQEAIHEFAVSMIA
jgi:hypothetical protein